MSELQTLSMADLKALLANGKDALDALKSVREGEVGEAVLPLAQDIVDVQGVPTIEKSGWTHFEEVTHVVIGGTQFRVNISLTDVEQTKTRKAAIKAAEEAAEAAKKVEPAKG